MSALNGLGGSKRYGAAGLPREQGSTERYGAVAWEPLSTAASASHRHRSSSLDGPFRSVDAWEKLIAQAEAEVAKGFFKHLTFKERNELDADRDFYEQDGREATHEDHRKRIAAVLDAIRAWIKDTSQSAVAQIRDNATRNHFLADVDWSKENFPGSGRPNTAEAEVLFKQMAILTPERRVPFTVTYHDVDAEVVTVPDSGDRKLWPEAKEGFRDLRGSASGDGVALGITSAWRSAEKQKQLSNANPNPKAVAKGRSAHVYGLAVDLDLASGNALGIRNASTGSMANVVLMYRSPVYKWLFINADKIGWYPYRREPWHWEFNASGLAARFAAASSQGLSRGASTDSRGAARGYGAPGRDNVILISGGPGLFAGKDKEHDQSWANYVTPPLQKAAKLAVDGADVYWFVYKPAYVARWNDDVVATDKRRRDEVKRVKEKLKFSSYVDLIEGRAKEKGWHLFWFTSAADLLAKLNTFRDPIVRVWFWGHARNDLWFTLGHNGNVAVAPDDATAILRIADIPSKLKATLAPGGPPPKHRFIGCNTAAFAKQWATNFGVCAEGVAGKIEFGAIPTTGGEPTLVDTATIKLFCGGESSSTKWSAIEPGGDDDDGRLASADEPVDLDPCGVVDDAADVAGNDGGTAAAAYGQRSVGLAVRKNVILISGGPGLYATKDVQHDKSWANYVTPPLQKGSKLDVEGADTYWFVYKPAYVARWSDDADHRRSSVREVKGKGFASYVDMIEQRAKARGWKLFWITGAADLWKKLNTFKDPIVRVWYWGHARSSPTAPAEISGLWLTLGHDDNRAVAPSDKDAILRVGDIPSKLKASLASGGPPPKHRFVGCNSATFAKKWAANFGVCALGVEGNIDFSAIHSTGGDPKLVGSATIRLFCDGETSSTEWASAEPIDAGDGYRTAYEDAESEGELLTATMDDEAGPTEPDSGVAAFGGLARALDAPLFYGVAGARITDPFYRSAVEKQKLTGRSEGRSKHLGVDVSLTNARGRGADDARRGLAVYATLKDSIPLRDLNAVRVDRDGTAAVGLGIQGTGNAALTGAVVFVQPWSDGDNAYGGVIGLACRYRYSGTDGAPKTMTLYVEYLHLITERFPPKDGTGAVISAADWAATGKAIGFGPRMRPGAKLTPAELTGPNPLLVGYLGATQFPHVHVQAAYGEGEHGYMKRPRFDPVVMLR